jgi:lipopolysaccharide transport system permease protein
MSSAEPALRIIEPRQPHVVARVGEFWRYRRLIPWFGQQMLQKMYRRTWLGWLWIPLRPVIQVTSSAFVFGGLLNVASGPVPYLLSFLLATAMWDLFSYTLLWGTRSIEMGRRVLRMMYVPRLTVLAGCLIMSGTIFAIYGGMATIALLSYLAIDGHFYLVVGVNTLAAFAGMALALLLALSIACFTAPMAVRARDVRFVTGMGLGFWMSLSPVIYPLSTVPASYRTIIELNPMTAPLELFRIGVFNEGHVPMLALASTFVFIAVIGSLGLRFFNRSESRALDAL